MSDEAARALEASMLAAPPAVRGDFELVERDGRVLQWSAEFVILRVLK